MKLANLASGRGKLELLAGSTHHVRGRVATVVGSFEHANGAVRVRHSRIQRWPVLEPTAWGSDITVSCFHRLPRGEHLCQRGVNVCNELIVIVS